MSNDEQINQALRRLTSTGDGPPPSDLLERARAEAPGIRSRRGTKTRRGALVAVGLSVALLAASFSAPGRAATGWVAEIAGVGESPSVEHPYDQPGAVVLDSGQLPGGTPYELVARLIDASERFPQLSAGAAVCLDISLPSVPANEQDVLCAGDEAVAGDEPPFTSYGALQEPGAAGGAILFGLVEDPAVRDVRVVDKSGDRLPAETKLLPVSQEMLDRSGRESPLRFFVGLIANGLVDEVSRGEMNVYATGVSEDGAETDPVLMFDSAD